MASGPDFPIPFTAEAKAYETSALMGPYCCDLLCLVVVWWETGEASSNVKEINLGFDKLQKHLSDFREKTQQLLSEGVAQVTDNMDRGPVVKMEEKERKEIGFSEKKN